MLNINDLRSLCDYKSIAITKHAKNRLAERSITVENIQHAIQTGEIIEHYKSDKPFPSCLLLGHTEQNKYIHIVVGVDTQYLYIITAYEPDESEWEPDLKTRKEQRT